MGGGHTWPRDVVRIGLGDLHDQARRQRNPGHSGRIWSYARARWRPPTMKPMAAVTSKLARCSAVSAGLMATPSTTGATRLPTTRMAKTAARPLLIIRTLSPVVAAQPRGGARRRRAR